MIAALYDEGFELSGFRARGRFLFGIHPNILNIRRRRQHDSVFIFEQALIFMTRILFVKLQLLSSFMGGRLVICSRKLFSILQPFKPKSGEC